ncbi:lef-4 [Cryptophlebia leucotreta granulovirus]|uniref:Lef-4 n=1 Tax=Cryptophlebia leucotreta granulosis virus TaxID=35254 RepID=Q7T5K7_GVCL|nr:lef-4 [Cryptophlebia leucotreta granulovirus]AAQ21681.1 lef-4 [Cryptophlebia leucotreta granulovirus]
MMSSEREQELSYTFTYSQDVLYKLKEWLDVNLKNVEQYVEVYDIDDVRTRIFNEKILNTVKKRLIESNRLVVMVGENFVPMVNRDCRETIYKSSDSHLKRVSQTRVYKTHNDLEIKFEQIYYEYNVGDSMDPLTATKQITLYNLIQPENPIDITINSHLGSDEILANCRLELEYKDNLNESVLLKAAQFVDFIEGFVLRDVIISPFISHTNLFNEICYKPFVNELTIGEYSADIKFWAVKLDGIRGKAYIVNGVKMFIQLDDMQMFCGTVERDESELKLKILNLKISQINSDSCDNIFYSVPFLYNRIVCFQVEYLCTINTIYITDVVSVYKYKYDNRNQYDVSYGVSVDVSNSVNFLNNQHNTKTTLTTNCGKVFSIKFQQFHTNLQNVKDDVPNDGFVGISDSFGLVKIKPQKSYEMKYTNNKTFLCSFGEYSNSENEIDYKTGKIYEVIIVDDNKVKVLKERPDRLISN